MKGSIIPFVVALAVFAAGFFAIDYAIMAAQGLSLVFNG